MKTIDVLSPTDKTYVVGKKLAEGEDITLYECRLEDGRICMFKIAVTSAQNGVLDREAFLLGEMAKEAGVLEEEYARLKPGKHPLNYHFVFPTLVETFLDHDGRRVNVLSFSAIANELGDLVPISLISERERVRVDPRTSAWILAKLLKTLVFTHSQNITGQRLTGDNIIINRAGHTVAIFDWTDAAIVSAGLDEAAKAVDIATITQSVIELLCGKEYSETFALPLHEEQLTDSRYEDFLRNLAEGHESDVVKVHGEFYKLIRDLWPREYHEFTTIRL